MAAPIYHKIKEEIKKMIQDIPENTPVPSERDMSARYHVSRMTVRNAVNELVSEGVLYRDKNKGTFVSNRNMIKKNTSTEAMQSMAEEDFAIIYFSVKTADNEIAPHLGIGPDDLIIRIVRLNKKNERPQSVEELYYTRSMIDDKDVNDLKKLLNLKHYIDDGSVNQKFIPMQVPVKYINLLQVKLSIPIIMVESTIMSKSGKPLVFIREYNNPFEKVIEVTS